MLFQLRQKIIFVFVQLTQLEQMRDRLVTYFARRNFCAENDTSTFHSSLPLYQGVDSNAVPFLR